MVNNLLLAGLVAMCLTSVHSEEINIKDYPEEYRTLGVGDYNQVHDRIERDIVTILANEGDWISANVDAAFLLARIQDIGPVWEGKSISPW